MTDSPIDQSALSAANRLIGGSEDEGDDDTFKVTCEGGPLDGTRFTTQRGVNVLNVLAIKDASGAWVDPRTWANSHGFAIPEDMPPTQWPQQVVDQVVQVEYLIDPTHETAAFREPAQIRERPDQEPEGEWETVNPRTVQASRMIAWKAAATALGEVVGTHPAPDDCEHVGKCTTYAMHVALIAVDAIVADGLRIVEPLRYTGNAEPLAFLFHEAYERLAPEHGWETQAETRVPWQLVPEANRTLMVAVAAEVLQMLDMRDRVVAIRIPESAPPSVMDGFEALGRMLREECGAEMLLALPAALGLTMETLDEEAMRKEGWVRAPHEGTATDAEGTREEHTSAQVRKFALDIEPQDELRLLTVEHGLGTRAVAVALPCFPSAVLDDDRITVHVPPGCARVVLLA